MGFQSLNDLINKTTGGSAPGVAEPQRHRVDWSKQSLAGSVSRWQDLSYQLGSPTSHADASGYDGNWVYKGGFQGGSNFWTLGDASWRWTTGNVITKMSNNSYYLAASGPLNSQVGVYSLCEFNGKLYGGTSPGGRLFEWDGFNNWVQVAPALGAETLIYSLCVFNGKLYGGTSPGGRLYEWNGVDAWVEKAGAFEAQTAILPLCVYNDGGGDRLYGGTAPNGKLFRWDGVSAWVRVADTLGGQSQINALCVFNGKLYGSTSSNGQLLEWNSGGLSWTLVGPQSNAQAGVYSLSVFDDGTGDKLYGGTGSGGRLFQWNGVNAWVEKAPQLVAPYIQALAVYGGKLYGGCGNGAGQAFLYEWNGSNAWTLVATPNPAQNTVQSLKVFNGKLYAGTYQASTGGRLLEWIPTNVGTASLTATMQRQIIPGNVYRVQFTIGNPGGVGAMTAKLGGVFGSPHAYGSAAGVFVEYITAINADPLEFTISAAGYIVASVDSVSVTAVAQASFPYGSDSRPADDTGMCAMPHGGNVSPQTKHLINVSTNSPLTYGELLLVDRLLSYSGITQTTGLPQALHTSLPLPRYTDGKGVRAYLVSNGNGATGATGSFPQNVSISYTNSNGVAGRAMPVTVGILAGDTPGRLCCTGTTYDNFGPFLPLASGDQGVRSVESVQFSAANTIGECTLVLCKPLLYLPLATAQYAYERETLNQLPALPRIYDGACLQWLYIVWSWNAGAGYNIQGYLDFAWG